MRAVAASHEVTLENRGVTVSAVVNAGMITPDALDRRDFRPEPDLAAIGEALFDQILDDFLLSVDGDPPSGQFSEVDPVLFAGEPKADPIVDQSLAAHPLADAGRRQQVGGSLLQDAGTNPPLHIVAAARFEHHRIDPLLV